MLQGYTKHYPCSGEELAAALASSLSEPRQAEPVPERAPYTSPSTLKSSSTMRSTSDTAGRSSKSVMCHVCVHVNITDMASGCHLSGHCAVDMLHVIVEVLLSYGYAGAEGRYRHITQEFE